MRHFVAISLAFSMAFGALFSKTWRVHKIFTAQQAIKKKVKNPLIVLIISPKLFYISLESLIWK